MKRLGIAIFIVLGVVATPVLAQRPATKPLKIEAATPTAEPSPGDTKPADLPKPPSVRPVAPPDPYATSLGELKPTQEMWFYEQQMRQRVDPKMAVRRAAEFRAEQRQLRLAATQWFGYSNLRPRMGIDPIHSDFAPSWSGNNSYYPFRWTVGNDSVIILRPEVYVR
jgi:hypothetical protein